MPHRGPPNHGHHTSVPPDTSAPDYPGAKPSSTTATNIGRLDNVRAPVKITITIIPKNSKIAAHNPSEQSFFS